jgi:hypothetical protein
METAKAGAVAGEGKAVTSERSSFGKISCGEIEHGALRAFGFRSLERTSSRKSQERTDLSTDPG